MADRGELTVRIAASAERRAALGLALRPLAPSARGPLLDAIGRAPAHALGAFDALVVAVTRRGDVRAAAWAQPSPGRAAAVWPPEWEGGRPPSAVEAETRLLQLAAAACDAARVSLTQAMFEVSDDPRSEGLKRAGFRWIAELLYLGRSLPGGVSPPPPGGGATATGGLGFEAYSARSHDRLKRVIRRTYEGSLDCPGLDGVRDLEDVLAGYRATGRHDPANWLLATLDGRDVGALLVTEHPESDQAELVYLGLAPEARGRGLGGTLIERAVALGERMGTDCLLAAVDRANAPARTLYDRAGFAVWAERTVFVRTLRGG